MFGVGVAAFFLLLAVKIPDISTDKNIKPTTYMSIIKNPAFFLLILMCGFYYIPEHGLQNWLTTYASEHLGFTVSEGSFFTGLFYAFMTVGRLIFAVLVNKLGPKKSLFIFSVFYSVLYIVGVAAGKKRDVYTLCGRTGKFCSLADLYLSYSALLSSGIQRKSRGACNRAFHIF